MSALKRMLPYVKPYTLETILLVVTAVLIVGMELVAPRALKFIIDEGIQETNLTVIIQGSGLMLIAAVIGAGATLGQGVFRARLSQGLAYDLRNILFTHIQSFSLANLDYMKTGQLMTRLSSDVDLVRMFVSAGFALLLRILLMIAGSVLMMLLIDWQLAIIMLLLLPCAGLLIWFVMHLARPIFTIVQQKLSALNTTVQENLAGVQVVKAFVQERFEINRFNKYNSDYMLESIRVGRILAVALPLLTLLTNIGLIAMITFGGLSVINSRLTVGELVAFNSYLLISMAPLMLLGNILTMVSRAEASAERVWEVLDTQPALKLINNPYISHSITGEVSLIDVSFQYDGINHLDEGSTGVPTRVNGRKVVDGISLEIRAGQRVAFLGATGSGKSTLISLIPRFYDPSIGSIMIDGRDVKDWDLQALRRNIGFVLQETTLFSGTIHQNIAYGKPNASLDEVIAAARIAQAHDFISALPGGYESWVEERGANLSGGQKQRIAIARALLISPKILILDDSTSSVDMATETLIQESLDQITDDLTIIIVAQRLSSVINADQIYVIDNGRIEAMGTHEELLQKSEIYQEIYYSQLGNGLPVQDQAAG